MLNIQQTPTTDGSTIKEVIFQMDYRARAHKRLNTFGASFEEKLYDTFGNEVQSEADADHLILFIDTSNIAGKAPYELLRDLSRLEEQKMIDRALEEQNAFFAELYRKHSKPRRSLSERLAFWKV